MSAETVLKTAVPPHVPPRLVFDYDHMSDPRLNPHPHAGAARLAAEAPPIFFTPRYCGHWVVTRLADVTALARDTQHLSTRRYNLFGRDEPLVVFPMMLDPPEHSRFRAPITQAFSPQTMNGLLPQIRLEAQAVVEAVRPLGRCDFMHDVAEPFSVKMFMRMTGMPLELYDDFRRWVTSFFRTADDSERVAIYNAVWDAMTGAIEARQTARRDDVISRLIDADVGGRQPLKEELQRYCMQLFFGGLDTLSHSFARLASDPATQARLREKPTGMGAAADELLRLHGITTPLRLVVEDFEYQGVPFKAGDMLMLHTPAANLDPEAFPEPAAFVPGRPTRHVTFNSGPHTCPGAYLSRLELKTLLEEWLAAIPPFGLDPAAPPAMHGGIVFAMAHLPLRWPVD